jgi:hypothetical protein
MIMKEYPLLLTRIQTSDLETRIDENILKNKMHTQVTFTIDTKFHSQEWQQSLKRIAHCGDLDIVKARWLRSHTDMPSRLGRHGSSGVG